MFLFNWNNTYKKTLHNLKKPTKQIKKTKNTQTKQVKNKQ